jgi:hypothetical protein
MTATTKTIQAKGPSSTRMNNSDDVDALLTSSRYVFDEALWVVVHHNNQKSVCNETMKK